MFLWLCKGRKMLSTVKRITTAQRAPFLLQEHLKGVFFFFDKLYLSNVPFAFEWDTNSGLLSCFPHKAKRY